MSEPAARAVVSDDGTIWLTAYSAAGETVPVALAPVRAVALAGELIEAAVPKLNATEISVETKPAKRRGGDRKAEQRRELHDGLRGMASLLGLGKGKSAAEIAKEITHRCKRYQPMRVETDPVRREIQRIRNAGVPLSISQRHMVRIISNRTSKKP
jgi:hypothetical protein